MIDLHYLHVPEAVRYAEQELQAASRRDDRSVQFIVGTFFNWLFGGYDLNEWISLIQARESILKVVERKSGQPWKNSVTST
jgi:hypothetical protein